MEILLLPPRLTSLILQIFRGFGETWRTHRNTKIHWYAEIRTHVHRYSFQTILLLEASELPTLQRSQNPLLNMNNASCNIRVFLRTSEWYLDTFSTDKYAIIPFSEVRTYMEHKNTKISCRLGSSNEAFFSIVSESFY